MGDPVDPGHDPGPDVYGEVVPIRGHSPANANMPPARVLPDPLRWPEIARPLPPVPWLCKELHIAPGRPVLLSAAAGAGKTWIAVSLALAVASSGMQSRAIDCVDVQRHGKVVHLNFDYPAASAKRRYQRVAYGLDFTPREILPWLDLYNRAELAGRSLVSPDARSWLKSICKGATLCVIDALRGAIPGVDLNDSRVRDYIDLLLEVSDATGCTFVVIHHERKSSAGVTDDGPKQDKAGGSHQIVAGCDVTLHVAKEGSAWRIRSGKVSEGQSDEEGVLTELVDVDADHAGDDGVAPGVRFQRVHAEEAAQKRARLAGHGAQTRVASMLAEEREICDQIVKLIRDNPERMGSKRLAAGLGKRKADVVELLATLAATGRVVNLGSPTVPRWVVQQTETT